jgi:hypothetical protein
MTLPGKPPKVFNSDADVTDAQPGCVAGISMHVRGPQSARSQWDALPVVVAGLQYTDELRKGP